jgi:para-aminobenzoate synthetase / 4-amino-4-deoxychorismate lyase
MARAPIPPLSSCLMYHTPPNSVYSLLQRKDNVVLLETLKFDADNYRSYVFIDPIESFTITLPEEVPSLLESIQRYLQGGYYAAGYFGYECGYCFEQIAPFSSSKGSLAHIGIYQKPLIFNHISGKWENHDAQILKQAPSERSTDTQCAATNLRFGICESEYFEKINRIKTYIHEGDTYQINFTGKYAFDVEGPPIDLFNELKKKQRVPYAAYMKFGSRSVISLSPELFFRIRNGVIQTKPMKGTVKRGRTLEEDERLAHWLTNDPKNRSENVMIVDLLRNDLGKISETGSVTVPSLFTIEKYQTLFQMTSTVEGRISDSVTLFDVFKSIFPCGSVTGAPKIRSMQIIHELEKERRGVYTGAIGFCSPNKEAVFNVAIRTLVIDGRKGEMGTGGGIVYDSNPEDEYNECKLKADFLTSHFQDFELLETLLWKDGYPFLKQHLHRLTQSAKYFDFPCNIDSIEKQLHEHSGIFEEGSRHKIRLRVNASGAVIIESSAIADDETGGLIALADIRTDSHNRFLYHKTTNRELYDRLFHEAEIKGFTDVIFMNENNEITEGSRNNIFIEKDGTLFTPPIECGLLNGVYRQHVIATRPPVVERTLHLSDLLGADKIYLCNAVRGMREVKLRM